MESDLEDISDEQLIREISDTYPELLGWYTREWDAPSNRHSLFTH
jgi:hypothetical protein